jgi:hypothetical protein
MKKATRDKEVSNVKSLLNHFYSKNKNMERLKTSSRILGQHQTGANYLHFQGAGRTG